MLTFFQHMGQAGFEFIRQLLARAFDPPFSPLRHLGSLTIFFCWIVLISGIWLFVFFHTSVQGAYASVEYLTHEQWYFGGVMRSLHRYASDAAIITLTLHIAKELFFDRYRGKRWFSWVTGVPLLWLLIPLGITGYWLVWDKLAQYVALSSSELVDWLPIFTDSMARNFLSDENLSDRFFTLMAFLHVIGLPLFLVIGIFIHVVRISRPKVNPPRSLMAGTLVALTVLSLLYPAFSQGPADLAQAPADLGLDWYYLWVYPLIQAWSPGWVWGFLVGMSLLLFIAPWLPPARTETVAVVDLNNCNGCERCVDDCPYSAVSMAPRSDGLAYETEAVVDPDLCVSCGICVGACPTATPFRNRSSLVPGIDLPELSAVQLRQTLKATSSKLTGNPRVLAICCEGSKPSRQLKRAGNSVVEIKCMAHLPPPFIDFILNRDLADGVFLAGCAGGDCQYRFGIQWTEQRIARERDPQLRKRVDRKRIGLGWQQPWTNFGATDALAAFKEGLSRNIPLEQRNNSSISQWPIRILALVVSYGLFSLLVGWLSNSPRYQLLAPDEAIVSLSLSHAGQRLQECRTLSQEELEELPPNMRAAKDCPRERRPILVEFRMDGDTLYSEEVAPSGIWDDGEATVYQRMNVVAGPHRFFIGIRDSDRSVGFDYQKELEVVLNASQNLRVEFDSLKQTFIFR